MCFVKKFSLQITCSITQFHFVYDKALFSIKLLLWKALEKVLFTQQKYNRFGEMTDRD